MCLICEPCRMAAEATDATAEFGIELCARTKHFYQESVLAKDLDRWLWDHRDCGGEVNPDHFRLALKHPANSDQPALAHPAAVGVKLALVKH